MDDELDSILKCKYFHAASDRLSSDSLHSIISNDAKNLWEWQNIVDIMVAVSYFRYATRFIIAHYTITMRMSSMVINSSKDRKRRKDGKTRWFYVLGALLIFTLCIFGAFFFALQRLAPLIYDRTVIFTFHLYCFKLQTMHIYNWHCTVRFLWRFLCIFCTLHVVLWW